MLVHKAGSCARKEKASRTTVTGMLGAFGKMNLTCSNLPLINQFSARPTLEETSPCQCSGREMERGGEGKDLTILYHCVDRQLDDILWLVMVQGSM